MTSPISPLSPLSFPPSPPLSLLSSPKEILKYETKAVRRKLQAPGHCWAMLRQSRAPACRSEYLDTVGDSLTFIPLSLSSLLPSQTPLLLTLSLTSKRRHSPPPPSAIPPLSQLHHSPRHTPLLLPSSPYLRPILLPALLLADLRNPCPRRRPCLWQRLFPPGPQEPANGLQCRVEDRKMDRPGHAGRLVCGAAVDLW